MQEETVTNGEHEDTLVNDSGLEKPAASIPSKVKGARKSAKKEEVDLSSEDEALHVEDLEPPGVAAAKVCFTGSGIKPCPHVTGGINHFTVVCSVTWPLNGSEAGGDLILMQSLLLLLCKSNEC